MSQQKIFLMLIRLKKEIVNENLTEKNKKNKDETHPCFLN